MVDQAAGKLKVQELHCLLAQFRAYLESDRTVILTREGSPDCCGNPIRLDGKAFLNGFLEFLKAGGQAEPQKMVRDLCLVMEISTYVRSGGTKAMAYRLETGCSKITPDYFDALVDELCYDLIEGELRQSRQLTDVFLFQRLKEVDAQDESEVASSIKEIDEILIQLNRKLEDASLAALGTNEPKGELGSKSIFRPPSGPILNLEGESILGRANKPSRPPTTVQKTTPLTTVQETAPPTAVQETAPPTAVQETAPPTAVQETTPPTAAQETAPPTAVQETTPPTTIKETEPPANPVGAMPCVAPPEEPKPFPATAPAAIKETESVVPEIIAPATIKQTDSNTCPPEKAGKEDDSNGSPSTP